MILGCANADIRDLCIPIVFDVDLSVFSLKWLTTNAPKVAFTNRENMILGCANADLRDSYIPQKLDFTNRENRILCCANACICDPNLRRKR